MAGAPVTYRGVILSSTEYKDKDRVLKFLTKDDGLIDIYVKGTGKLNSSNAFTSVPFMVCDITASDSHGYLYFRSGSIVESNSRIMTDLDTITAAAHYADLLIDISMQSDNSKEAYELAVYAFYYLSNNPSKWELFVAAFNWKVLSILGFTVTYSKTNDTMTDISGTGFYYASVCGGDIYSGKKFGDTFYMLSGQAVNALNSIANSEFKNLFAIQGSESLSSSLMDFTLKYLSFHLEKDYRGRFTII